MKDTNQYNLTGKTALVTGGSQGIGKAISLELAAKGANVVIVYRSASELAESTASDIRQMGVECHLFQCDLSHVDTPRNIVGFLDDSGVEVDILVLNASIQYRKAWNEITAAEFEHQINTNLRSSLFMIQELYPIMLGKKWGRILTVGSVQQTKPHQQMLVYAASKVAQVSMVKSLAPQFAPFGVTINNLAPGTIYTGRNEDVLNDAVYKEIVEAKIPAGYIGDPADCAAMAALLCSDAGSYITGQDIFVDGGLGLST